MPNPSRRNYLRVKPDLTTTIRFGFGENWEHFLQCVTESHVREAELSLRNYLGFPDLAGRSFLDVGSGSGLFSLAARRLGATVHSFDYDPHSVACTEGLKKMYLPGDALWTVERGDILDPGYLSTLSQYDIVYSWGVLHHTGKMWKALENIATLPLDGGYLFVALYNDNGKSCRRWLRVKQAYNFLPDRFRFLVLWPSFLVMWGPRFLSDLFHGYPSRTWKNYSENNRGMSAWHDVVDWVGGYPYEFATTADISEYFTARNYTCEKIVERKHGCNEYVFRKNPASCP
jgi:2-polyprenyl-3-methyl-5-hydroxy-6-metoxy-1,4-benzoquinol methylase